MKNFFNCYEKDSFNESILDKRYIIQEKLGDGYTSEVHKVLDIYSGEIKVAKIFANEAISFFKKEEKIFKNITELKISSNIRFFSSGFGPLTINGKTQQKYYIILEYGSKGNLFDKIEKTPNGFSESACKLILFEIIKNVIALHEKGICHRDIKPENILLVGDNYDIKLCDFGFSTYFLNKDNKKKKLKKRVGSTHYYAPEIAENKPYDGEKVDIFSIGSLLFVLMTKSYGFAEAKTFDFVENESQRLYHLIKNNKINEYWNIIEKTYKIKILSPQFKQLFIKMIAYNPSERPSFEDIMNSEWMKEIKDANDDYLKQLRIKMISEMN